jgi:hypothetical protein
MDEYQLVDALNSTMAYSWTISQYGLSILTGYLLIAHFIGMKVNLVPGVLCQLCISSAAHSGGSVEYWNCKESSVA